MDLLEKFEIVTIKTDDRISEADSEFCITQQEAYETAVLSFQELLFMWKDIEAQQKKVLGLPDGSPGAYKKYIFSKEHVDLSAVQIRDHIGEMHHKFITAITLHFNQAYHMSISIKEIEETLLPAKPAGTTKEEKREARKQYREQITELILQYGDVVDQIFRCLDGRSFSDQALYELTSRCHKAAWSGRNHTPAFERKKGLISFYNASEHKYTVSTSQWKVLDYMKPVLQGLAHFELGCFDELPQNMFPLVHSGVPDDRIELPTCTKLSYIRCFRNGRLDVKFTGAEYAEQFVQDYLGTY